MAPLKFSKIEEGSQSKSKEKKQKKKKHKRDTSHSKKSKSKSRIFSKLQNAISNDLENT